MHPHWYHIPGNSPLQEPEKQVEDAEGDQEEDEAIDVESTEDEAEGSQEQEKTDLGQEETPEEQHADLGTAEIPLTQPSPILDESQRPEEVVEESNVCNPWDALNDVPSSPETETPKETEVQPDKTPACDEPESLYEKIQEVQRKLNLAKKELTAKIPAFVFFGNPF